MKRSNSWTIAALVFGLGAGAADAQQTGNVLTRTKLSGTMLKTPEYNLKGNQPRAPSGEWFEIGYLYETAPDWTDEIALTFYALLENPRETQSPSTLLKGTLTSVNVEKGRHRAAVYIHPHVLKRFGAGKVKAVGVEMRVGGQLMARESQPASNQVWWEALPARDGWLLAPAQTPFGPAYYMEFEMAKPGAP